MFPNSILKILINMLHQNLYENWFSMPKNTTIHLIEMNKKPIFWKNHINFKGMSCPVAKVK